MAVYNVMNGQQMNTVIEPASIILKKKKKTQVKKQLNSKQNSGLIH